MSVGYLLEIWETEPRPENVQAVRKAIFEEMPNDPLLCEYSPLCFFVSVLLRGETPEEHAERIRQAAWDANGGPCQVFMRYYSMDEAEEHLFPMPQGHLP